MPARKRKEKSKAEARRRAAATVSPEFAVVMLAAGDYGSADDVVAAARAVVEETAGASGAVAMVLDCAGVEDWAPRLAALLEPLGATPTDDGLVVLTFNEGLLDSRLIRGDPGLRRAKTTNAVVCPYGVVTEDGAEAGGVARLRRGLFFVAEGGPSAVGVFLFWATLTRAPRRRVDRTRLLDACDGKILDLLGEEFLGDDAPPVDGFVVHGTYDLPGVRVASSRWAGDVEASELARGYGAPVWPAERPSFLPPEVMNFSRDYRASGVQVYPNRLDKEAPPNHRIRVTSPVGILLGMQEDPEHA
jgi:hypothetical protein